MKKKTINNRNVKAKTLLMLCIIIGLVTFPFIYLRIIEQNWVMISLNVFIFLSMFFISVYVYKTNQTKIPSLWLLLIIQLSTIISFYMSAASSANWLYPAMLSAFFVIKPHNALRLNFIILFVCFPRLIIYFNMIEIVIVVISYSVSNIIVFSTTQGLRVQTQELKKAASEDYLTSTGNRRSLNLSLNELWISLQKKHSIVSLIILDIDHFKKVNDVYGHLLGDDLLVKLSLFLKKKLRNNDKLYRYGGEEFLIICLGKKAEDAYELAQEIRQEIKCLYLIEETKITVSLGVAQYIAGESMTQWIARVDKSLYQAKNQGRDRVIKA